MKILISGGHLTPALAFIEHVQTAHSGNQIVFAGRVYSQDTNKQLSQEKEEVLKKHVEFLSFSAPRANAFSMVDRLLYPLRLVVSVVMAMKLLLQEKPDVFLSFGSYVAVPLAIASFCLRVPVVTHEQTKTVGEATRFMVSLAKKVAVTYDSSLDKLPPAKSVLTGNPLRPVLFIQASRPEWIQSLPEKPILYITGGNQGSEIINTIVQQSLKPLVKQWFVIHQCGAATEKRNYLTELLNSRSHLPQTLQADYVVKEWISESELSWIYHKASVVIARSGANTVQELAALAIPAVLIPLPFAHHDEQHLNAKYLADIGGAVILPQKDLSPTSLIESATKVQRLGRSMKLKLKSLPINLDGAEKLYQVVKSVTV